MVVMFVMVVMVVNGLSHEVVLTYMVERVHR